ncbi:hypothetical protein MRX96_057602 [Rhipicephalus microplus]
MRGVVHTHTLNSTTSSEVAGLSRHHHKSGRFSRAASAKLIEFRLSLEAEEGSAMPPSPSSRGRFGPTRIDYCRRCQIEIHRCESRG